MKIVAIVLLMRRFGLRIFDVATLERGRIKDGRIFLHAMKNGAPLWLPLWDDVAAALESVPLPQGVPANSKYVFWTGLGARVGHTKTVDRTLKAVFRESGIERASIDSTTLSR